MAVKAGPLCELLRGEAEGRVFAATSDESQGVGISRGGVSEAVARGSNRLRWLDYQRDGICCVDCWLPLANSSRDTMINVFL